MRIERRRVTIEQVRVELAEIERRNADVLPAWERALVTHEAMLEDHPDFARWSLLRTAVKLAESRR